MLIVCFEGKFLFLRSVLKPIKNSCIFITECIYWPRVGLFLIWRNGSCSGHCCWDFLNLHALAWTTLFLFHVFRQNKEQPFTNCPTRQRKCINGRPKAENGGKTFFFQTGIGLTICGRQTRNTATICVCSCTAAEEL